MMVRRDKRLQLRGNNLVISQLEVANIFDDDEYDEDDDNDDDEMQVDDGGQYDCEIEADGDLPISVSHRLDILLPPRVMVVIITITITITNIIIICLKIFDCWVVSESPSSPSSYF